MISEEYRFLDKYTIKVADREISFKKDTEKDFVTKDIHEIYRIYSYIGPGQSHFNGINVRLLKYIAEFAIPDAYTKNNVSSHNIPYFVDTRKCSIVKPFNQYWHL